MGMTCEGLGIFSSSIEVLIQLNFNLWCKSFWNADITKDWQYKSVRFIVWIGKCWTQRRVTVFFWKVSLNSSPWRNSVSLSIHISGLLTENLCGLTGYECFHASTLAFKLVHKLLFFLKKVNKLVK